MVLGPTIAEAFDDLYYLERAAEVQVKAMAIGRPLKPIPHDVAQKAYLEMREGDPESASLQLKSVRCQLMTSEPDFAD
jgi:ribulose-5-phosphate 4-epimerase/fuculose-1-phosphate aldolase